MFAQIPKSIKKHLPDILSVTALAASLPFFFYKLGQSSLVSWDEAWYAEIARNIINSGNLFNLTWNGQNYYDHPPVGFWLIALGELVFGYSEFGVQVSSAIIGFLSVILVYFLGKEMFNRTVGFCSAAGLTSSFWFLYRARSGNLDVFLTFFFILTFYLAWKGRTDKRFLPFFGLSAALLFLTKTGIPVTIIPALAILFWGMKWNFHFVFFSGIVLFMPIYIWYKSQLAVNASFMDRYFLIGLPGVNVETSYLDNFNLAKNYVHNGIGKWFWPGALGVLGSFFVFRLKYLIFPLFCLSFFIPFVFSPKGHIWHLIPLHPFMIISFFSFSYLVADLITKWLLIFKDPKVIGKNKLSKYRIRIISAVLIAFALYLSSVQLKSAWVQFIDTTKYKSDEQILSAEAGVQPGEFFIDDDFGPTAVWYSGKNVRQIRDDDLKRLFEKEGQFSKVGNFVLITKQFRLDEQGIAQSRYKILKSDRDKILIITNGENSPVN